MRIFPGQMATPFTVTDIESNVISLDSYRGKKLLISFFRYASCPLCNLRVQELIRKHPEFARKGLSIIAFFESPAESIALYVGKQNPPFSIIAHPNREVYRLYGVESSWIKYVLGVKKFMYAVLVKGILPGKMEGDKALVPADFLINPDLTIHTAYYGRNIGDHLSMEKIAEFLNVN